MKLLSKNRTIYFAVFVLISFMFFSLSGLEANAFEALNFESTEESNVIFHAKVGLLIVASQVIQGVNHDVTGYVKILSSDGKMEGELLFAADGFKTDNKRRDQNIAYYLGSRYHPFIRFEPSQINFTGELENREDWIESVLVGELSINGITREIIFPVKYRHYNDMLSVDGTIDLRYSDYKMMRPAILGGLVKRARSSIKLDIHWYGKIVEPNSDETLSQTIR